MLKRGEDMRRGTACWSCFVILLVAACSSIQIKHEYDGEEDFSRLETFAWMATTEALVKCGDGTLASSNLYDAEIRNAVNRELSARGFEQDTEKPDFIIVFCTKGGHVLSHRYWGAIDLDEYREGTFVLDFVDADTQRLLWRGVAEGAMPDAPTPEQIQAATREAVRKLLDNFPPR